MCIKMNCYIEPLCYTHTIQCFNTCDCFLLFLGTSLKQTKLLHIRQHSSESKGWSIFCDICRKSLNNLVAITKSNVLTCKSQKIQCPYPIQHVNSLHVSNLPQGCVVMLLKLSASMLHKNARKNVKKMSQN